MSGSEHFDQAAATWDLADRRVALAHAVAQAIAARVPLAKKQSVLDFGCGTGLVTLELWSRVGSITGADTSPGMLMTLAGIRTLVRLLRCGGVDHHTDHGSYAPRAVNMPRLERE